MAIKKIQKGYTQSNLDDQQEHQDKRTTKLAPLNPLDLSELSQVSGGQFRSRQPEPPVEDDDSI